MGRAEDAEEEDEEKKERGGRRVGASPLSTLVGDALDDATPSKTRSCSPEPLPKPTGVDIRLSLFFFRFSGNFPTCFPASRSCYKWNQGHKLEALAPTSKTEHSPSPESLVVSGKRPETYPQEKKKKKGRPFADFFQPTTITSGQDLTSK